MTGAAEALKYFGARRHLPTFPYDCYTTLDNVDNGLEIFLFTEKSKTSNIQQANLAMWRNHDFWY